MARTFTKVKPLITLSDFLAKAKTVKAFTSSTGRRYSVKGFENDDILFRRLDAQETTVWRMSLKSIFKAYQELEDFATVNFKPFVPITHSPARGLLLHLGMLE